MKNAESLKAKIREIALKKHLNSMEVLQMYFFERFLDRLSKSKYKFNFVIKGGFLISSIIGVDNRTTMDIDTTVKGNSLDIMNSSIEIIKDMQKDNYLVKLWNTYLQENEYIEKIKFEKTLEVIEIIARKTIGEIKLSQNALN